MRRLVVAVGLPSLALVGLGAGPTAPADAGGRFTNTVAPAVTGTPRVGQPLELRPGTWTGEPATFRVEWLRDGEDTVVGTARTYTPTTADAGHFLTVLVTAEDDGEPSTSASESDRPSVTVLVPPAAGTLPRISGTVRVGRTIKVVNGTWSGSPDRFAYRWYRDAAPISGAVTSAYALKTADQGRRISVRVTAAKSGYPSTVAASARSAAVAKK